jgi:hypothetical protein
VSQVTELQALEARLKAKPPAGLRKLSDEELRDLAGAIDEVRRNQAAALQKAGDEAFRHIPWVLRGPIRKIMGA